ncbi:hypothetical protein FKM82_007942 [Ascaphus truei]
MATMAQSLNDLAEELTCSICLSTFTTPVTIPCGHNFCFGCLDLTWTEPVQQNYSCPQCRTTFDSKPELRKNTLLNNLVEQFVVRGDSDSDVKQEVDEEDVEEEEMDNPDVVLCDSCMKVPAAKTCLTCMASFCNDHLMPHIESPAFRDHQLKQPLKDLQQRKCAEHNKLLEYYCWEHSKCICCYCLVGHKQCQTFGLQEGKMRKELQYKKLLASLNDKMEKASNALDEVQADQRKVKDITQKKKDLLEGEFGEIKALVEEGQMKAMNRIEEEERKVDSKYSYTQNALGKKKNEFKTMKVKVESLLMEDDDLQFLKRATKLRDTTSADPFKPKIKFDEKLLNQIYRGAFSLKEMIRTKLNQPDEAPELNKNPDEDKQPQKYKPKKNPPAARPYEPPPKPSNKSPDAAAAGVDSIPNTREDLLTYAVRLTVDPNTAHKRVILSDRFTKLTVTDNPQNYADNPLRFAHCSQVLCCQGFSQGIHYWEVDLEGGNFSGIGVAYQSIARKGTESRLGRNKVSWCIEWFNGKLLAWHNETEKILTSPNTTKIGVLLNYDEGFLAFYSVSKNVALIYKFRARFTEPVFPAFWVFSSNTVLSISRLG